MLAETGGHFLLEIVSCLVSLKEAPSSLTRCPALALRRPGPILSSLDDFRASRNALQVRITSLQDIVMFLTHVLSMC